MAMDQLLITRAGRRNFTPPVGVWAASFAKLCPLADLARLYRTIAADPLAKPVREFDSHGWERRQHLETRELHRTGTPPPPASEGPRVRPTTSPGFNIVLVLPLRPTVPVVRTHLPVAWSRQVASAASFLRWRRPSFFLSIPSTSSCEAQGSLDALWPDSLTGSSGYYTEHSKSVS